MPEEVDYVVATQGIYAMGPKQQRSHKQLDWASQHFCKVSGPECDKISELIVHFRAAHHLVGLARRFLKGETGREAPWVNATEGWESLETVCPKSNVTHAAHLHQAVDRRIRVSRTAVAESQRSSVQIKNSFTLAGLLESPE